jgi:tyrosyl-tRNA synthetase
MKIDIIQQLLTRGVEEVIERKHLEKRLRAGEKLRIKHGVDPTTADLHLGYAVVYRKLRQFQDLGHRIIFLIGDFTGRFGDPTDEVMGSRLMRTKKEVEKLAKNYIEQISKILNVKKMEIRYNSEWYDKMSAEELLRLLSKFTTNQMMERNMFQERIKRGLGVGLHEPVYPVLQGYDSVMLKADLTIIGSDQKFNELQGRRMQEIFGQKPQDLIIMPLLVGTDGQKKMGQSLGNYIGITEAPDSQYGKIMSISDKLLPEYFALLTNLDFDKKENPRDAKMRLAYEIVKTYHREKEARVAQENFIKLFQKKEIPKDIEEIKVKTGDKLADILVQKNIIPSKSEFRRLVKNKAVDIDGRAIKDINYVVEKATVVKVGKKKFIRMVV